MAAIVEEKQKEPLIPLIALSYMEPSKGPLDEEPGPESISDEDLTKSIIRDEQLKNANLDVHDEQIAATLENKELTSHMANARDSLRSQIMKMNEISADKLDSEIKALRTCVGAVNREMTEFKQYLSTITGEYAMHIANITSIANKQVPLHGFKENTMAGLCSEMHKKMEITKKDIVNTEESMKKIECKLSLLTHTSESIANLIQSTKTN